MNSRRLSEARNVIDRSLSALAVAIAATATLYAQNTTIRLATVVPANSSWHKALLDMGAAWTKDTGGRVTLRIYDGGTQGDERTVLRLMRPGVDQLQASLMVSGLGEIDEAFNVFGMPFFFQSDEEALHVRGKLTPAFEKRVEAGPNSWRGAPAAGCSSSRRCRSGRWTR